MIQRIRRARPDDAEALNALAFRSKAHWGYEAAFLERVRESMRLRPEEVTGSEVWVLESPTGVAVGFHAVTPGNPAELEHLWVEPSAIGSGAGRSLLDHAIEIARAAGADSLDVDADPHAVGFYEHMGAVRIGETPSTLIPDRFLPRLRIPLPRGEQP